MGKIELVAAVSCHAALADEVVSKYVPGPVQVGPEIWVGAIAATIPFVIGSWEFAKRIVSHPFMSFRRPLAPRAARMKMQGIGALMYMHVQTCANISYDGRRCWCLTCRSYRDDVRSAGAVGW